ncbi:MORN repeat [Leishmania donovani]|uniref:MORN repeat family protein n=1 Tax=Leishmania donovani TaxID=5661 RepID=A0A504X909_LEIDO|nr:MORN repeat family protein [Leishmania donovani]CAJ1988348.1 MORN repeat [Leishmania donovani]VDZ44232.1 MORN_repeat_putative/Pfam:PF02493 [Leishmania donovani]
MPGVPDKILVGPTTYVHLRRKHRDYYVPNFLCGADGKSTSPRLPDDSEHVWRYSVSKAHHNTVFFFNAVTRKSVWVLPVVHRDGRTEPLGEGEAMRAIYSDIVADGVEAIPEATLSRLTKARVHKEKSMDARGKLDIDVTDSLSSTPKLVSAVAGQSKSTGARSPGDPPSETAAPHAAGPSNDSAAALQVVTRERVHASGLRAREAEAQRTSAAPSAIAEREHHRPTLQDRLAAWRARQHDPVSPAEGPHHHQQQPASTAGGPTAATTETPSVVVKDPYAYTISSTMPTDKKCESSSAEGALHTKENEALPRTPDATQGHSLMHTQASAAAFASTDPESVLHAPVPKQAQSRENITTAPPANVTAPAIQERELARAAALLHQEKIAAMQQEMAALESRRRALAVEQAEAEERARLAQARAAAERARLEEIERTTREQAQRRAAMDASAAAELRVQNVNEYLSKQRQLQEAAQSAVADSFTYASRIAAQLVAAAPRPENVYIPVKGKPSKSGGEASALLTPPDFRAHQVGRVTPAAAGPPAASPVAGEPGLRAEAKKESGGTSVGAQRGSLTVAPTSTGAATAQRRQGRLAYALPHLYEGEVITYRPSSSFTRQAVLNDRAAAIENQPPRALSSSAAGLTTPLILAAKRDGTGTQYYDAAHQHFFHGTWREDKRDGAGVLSLPTTAVQGGWRGDQLVGPAIVQTRHSKGAATFASGRPAGSLQAPGTGPTDTSSRDNGALPSTASHTSRTAAGTTTLTGNAVMELDNKALFVGALEEGRVRAPYVLQLGQGDYIEWLGAPARRGGWARSPAGASGELVKHTPAHAPSSSSAPASKAGTGECRIRFRNDDTYVGHVCNFQLHGFGYYRFAEDAHSYTGRFEAGLPHGEGLLIFANGDVYRGGFAKGLFDGHGTYASHTGHYVYEGDWVAGKMNGQGTLAFANGDVWKGTFRDDTRVVGAYTTLA